MEEKQNVSIRMSVQNMADIAKVAEREHLFSATLMRQWILQRLDTELVAGD